MTLGLGYNGRLVGAMPKPIWTHHEFPFGLGLVLYLDDVIVIPFFDYWAWNLSRFLGGFGLRSEAGTVSPRHDKRSIRYPRTFFEGPALAA